MSLNLQVSPEKKKKKTFLLLSDMSGKDVHPHMFLGLESGCAILSQNKINIMIL